MPPPGGPPAPGSAFGPQAASVDTANTTADTAQTFFNVDMREPFGRDEVGAVRLDGIFG
jgi:hypothetical protein